MKIKICMDCCHIVHDSFTECDGCHSKNIEKCNLDFNDCVTIKHATENPKIILAMAELRQTNIIEYELRMKQFKDMFDEKYNYKPIKPKEENIPKCPICGSTDLSKITTTQKAGKAVLFGLFAAGDMSKTWKCNKCGSKF